MKINIKQESQSQNIPITLRYVTNEGKRVIRKAGTKSSYEALGLKI